VRFPMDYRTCRVCGELITARNTRSDERASKRARECGKCYLEAKRAARNN